MEGRDEGESVEVDGARDDVCEARDLDGGPRRVEAAEGGGRRVVDDFDGDREFELAGWGRDGGGMRVWGLVSGFRLEFGFGRAGGGMSGLRVCCFCSGKDAVLLSLASFVVLYTLDSSILSPPPSSRVKDGIGSPCGVIVRAFGVLSGDAASAFLSVRSTSDLGDSLCCSNTSFLIRSTSWS